MQEILEITRTNICSLADAMAALESAATAHAIDLHIDFPRMLEEFGALWMIARSRLCMKRLPKNELRIRTWLRRPSAAVSNRDFALFDGQEEIGYAVQSWVLADVSARTILNMKKIPPLWSLPSPLPERSDVLKHLNLPELPTVEAWTIAPEELDRNGHLNNVRYIRRAEKYAPENALCLDVIFDHECFAGETLLLQAENGFVRGVKPDGTTSFRAQFYQGGSL